MNIRFLPSAAFAAAIAVLAGTNGCSSSDIPGKDALCCTDFQPGTDMTTVDFGGDASVKGQIHAFAQASGDLSALAGTAMADVTGACMNMAIDLGADANDAGANGKSGADLMGFWCDKATASIQATITASVSGSITLAIQPPECEVSVTAQAKCQGSCDVSGKCDVQANPPTCEGGQVEVSCSGSCTGSASASIDCSGSCGGTCNGGCTAQGGVACQGKCDGQCSVATDAGGKCNGTCNGTCSVTAPGVTCSGTCTGKCEGSCSPPAGQASVTCSGGCSTKGTPISCKGGTLKGGCQVDANCQANCNASAQAKASCTPPSVTVQASVKAGADAQFAILASTLKANLPALLLVIQAQAKAITADFTAVVSAGGQITTSGGLDVKSTACLANMVASVGSAATNFTATLQASVKVSGAVGGPTG